MGDLKKADDGALFQPGDPRDELRTFLRVEGGLTAAEIEAMSVREVHDAAQSLHNDLKLAREAERVVREAVTQGRLAPDAAALMTATEKEEYRRSDLLLYFMHDARARASSATPPPSPPPLESVTRTELAAFAADLVAVVAGQQAQIDELREQLARERNAKLALFGQQKVIDQLTRVPRDFKGFEATIELEEEASHSSSEESETKTENVASVADARDTRAGLKVLSQHVGSFDAGRKVNVAEMNRALERMTQSAKRQAKVRTKGRVHIKIGEVSGGKGTE